MGWVRIDDNFADHPKIIALSDSAFRLFITGLCYSNRQLTDGLIPYQMVMGWVGDNPLKPSDELEDQNLWERAERGFTIRSYDEYQPLREKVQEKREQAKERLKKYRDAKKREGNANETPPPTQPNPTQPNPNKDITYREEESSESENALVLIPLPRVHTANAAVQRISTKLADARATGVNSWNLSRLVEEEWDKLHSADDGAGCTALTAWYVSELQSRKLSSSEIGRIGQMTKRFGRISLLAIDEAASKDLDDLLSYALRVAQRMYADRKA